MEKQTEVGGVLEAASVPPFKEDLESFLLYLRRQLKKSGAEVIQGRAVGIRDVFERNPDVVVVGTGGKPLIPGIPGITRPNVVLAADVLMGEKEVQGEGVIIGGGMVGCELAEYLTIKGKKVTILEMMPRLASDVTRVLRADLLWRLRKAKVRIETDFEVTRISEHGVWGIRRSYEYGPNEAFFEADTIVLATGYKPDDGLSKELEGKLPVYNVGDSLKPGQVKDAVWAGFLAAMRL